MNLRNLRDVEGGVAVYRYAVFKRGTDQQISQFDWVRADAVKSLDWATSSYGPCVVRTVLVSKIEVDSRADADAVLWAAGMADARIVDYGDEVAGPDAERIARLQVLARRLRAARTP